ncbi:hypothetical protein BH23GEM11_BH23GEM11_07040 [soil metagenome]
MHVPPAPNFPWEPPSGPVRVALMFLLVFAWGAPASAQQQAGDRELQLTGSVLAVTGQEEDSQALALLQAKVGYFLTDRVEIGAFPSLTYTRVTVRTPAGDVQDSSTRLGFGAFGTYSFLAADAMTVPYLGGQAYRIDITNSEAQTWVGANAGLKYYFNRNMAFDMGGNALLGTGDAGGVLILFQFGLSYLF